MRFLTAIIFILFALIIPLTLGFPILPVDGDECAVPCDEIVGGGPPKDGIPAIDVPSFISAAEYDSQYAEPDDLILGVFFEGEARAYPADILNWHEIVNDEFNGISISITYCPLTWSGIAYQTTSLGKDNTLGTTGKLYENNLVFYDRQTDTYWSQILGLGIKGEHIGKKLPTIPIMQTTWDAWKAIYPDTVVLSRETGYSRSYDRNPYDFYQEIINEDIWFPTSYDWRWRPYSLYPPKTHTLVISLNNMTRLYSFEELTKQQFVNDKLGNQSYVVMYDEENKLSIAFSSVHNDHEYFFAPAKSGDYADSETFGLPIFQDNETQSVWNMRGQAIAGSLKGAQLEQLPGYNAFWFAATVFSEQATLFQAEFIEAPPSKTSQTGFQIINVFAFAGAIALVAWWGFKRRRNLPKK